jgi:hypothetical protein
MVWDCFDLVRQPPALLGGNNDHDPNNWADVETGDGQDGLHANVVMKTE